MSGADTYDVPEINKARETGGDGKMKVSSGFNQHTQNASSLTHITRVVGHPYNISAVGNLGTLLKNFISKCAIVLLFTSSVIPVRQKCNQ